MNIEEFINYHEVDHLGFQKYIESIGFKNSGFGHFYKEYIIDIYDIYYDFWTGSKWIKKIEFNDLTPFKVFKKELRSIKLKKILG